MKPSGSGDTETQIVGMVKNTIPRLIALRQDTHTYPELGFDTIRTTEVVAKTRGRLGNQAQRYIGKTNGMLDIHGDEPGQKMLLCADMDVPPVEKKTARLFDCAFPGKWSPVKFLSTLDYQATTTIPITRIASQTRAASVSEPLLLPA